MPLPSDVVIRDALPDELDAIAELTLAAYEEYAPDESSGPEWRKAWEEYRHDLADVRERVEGGATVIVAERGGRLIGTVTYFAPGTDKTDGGWPDEIAAVRLLGVSPAERGMGIGRALTEECIRRARDAGAPAVGLHTTDLMHIARDMYGRMGFVREPDRDFLPAPEILVAGYRLEL